MRTLLPMGLAALLLAACQRAPETGPIRIELSQVVGTVPLELGRGQNEPLFPLPNGTAFRVDKLRYYLSNVRLHRQDGRWVDAPRDAHSDLGYHLIDAGKPDSQRFGIEALPFGDYDGIEFLLGIDEARNHAGAQTGSLDPAQGLFWTWNSGYIFLVFEGHSPQAPDDGALTYHLGGGTPSLARTVYLPLSPKPAKIEAGIVPVIHLHADLGVLLGGQDLVAQPTAMDPATARPIADRAATMFRVDHLHHEPRAAPP